MSDYTIGDGTLINIANAIRAQEGSVNYIPVSNFASRISALEPDEAVTGDISNQNNEFYGVTANTISAIGNAIKSKDNLTGPVSGFAQRILNLHNDWVRPSDWPNYNYVDRTSEDAIYFTVKQDPSETTTFQIVTDSTYGASGRIYSSCYQNTSNNNNYFYEITNSNLSVTLEKGYIDSSGFHAIDVYRTTDITTEKTIAIGNGYEVWRVASNSNTRQIRTLAISRLATAPVVEIWGRTPYAQFLNILDSAVESFDVLFEWNEIFTNYRLKQSPFFFVYNSTLGNKTVGLNFNLKHINLNTVNWEDILCNSNTDFEYTQLIPGSQNKIVNPLDLSFLNNKTIYLNKASQYAIRNIFAGLYLKELVFPTVTVICRGDYPNSPVATVNKLIDIFYRARFTNKLDLSKMTIQFSGLGTYQSYYELSGFLHFINTPTVYFPTIEVPSGDENKVVFNETFMNMSTEEIYNVPDIMCKIAGYATTRFDYSYNLSRATMVRFFNKMSNMVNVSNTIVIESTVNNRLLPEDIAILTNKGHTLSVVTSS